MVCDIEGGTQAEGFREEGAEEIFRSKRNAVTGEWRRLRNEGLYGLFSSPNIIPLIKSGRMRLTGHVARMEEKSGTYRVLVGKSEEQKPHRRPRLR